MGVDLTDFAPTRCERDHYIGRLGRRTTSWTPCDCPGVITDGTRGRGHIVVQCRACEDEGVRTVYYDPPHAEPPHLG